MYMHFHGETCHLFLTSCQHNKNNMLLPFLQVQLTNNFGNKTSAVVCFHEAFEAHCKAVLGNLSAILDHTANTLVPVGRWL